jgi:hypothetical protein
MRPRPVYALCAAVLLALAVLFLPFAAEPPDTKLRSVITPEAEHMFAKTAPPGQTDETRQELAALAARYEAGAKAHGCIICTIRWEYETLGRPYRSHTDIRVYVKQFARFP